MAHFLTDETFALSLTHFRRIGRLDGRGYWVAALAIWSVDTRLGHRLPGRGRVDTRRLGLDVAFPAAMAGLSLGMVSGRRDVAAALGAVAVAVPLGWSGAPRSGWWPVPCRSLHRAGRSRVSRRGVERTGDAGAIGGGRSAMSLGLIPLAVLMWAVTYPARAVPMLAPGIERLPPRAIAYLRLAGPAALAALAAVNCLLTSDPQPRLLLGVEPIAVAACVLIGRADSPAPPRSCGCRPAGGRRPGARGGLMAPAVANSRPGPPHPPKPAPLGAPGWPSRIRSWSTASCSAPGHRGSRTSRRTPASTRPTWLCPAGGFGRGRARHVFGRSTRRSLRQPQGDPGNAPRLRGLRAGAALANSFVTLTVALLCRRCLPGLE